MTQRLDKQVAVVTGASRGIGRFIARELADGADILLAGVVRILALRLLGAR